MKKAVLLKMFKQAHPLLDASVCIITVDEIVELSSSDSTEIISYNPPLLQISVKHPFVFDNRLIPQKFNEIKVHNITMGIPFEFKPLTGKAPLFEIEDPKKYESFVDHNLDLIRETLKNPKLSKEEALDALTGNFNEHVEWYNNSKAEFLETYQLKNGKWIKIPKIERLKKLTKKYQMQNKNKSSEFLTQNNSFGKMQPGVE